jgi:hypothetical protein
MAQHRLNPLSRWARARRETSQPDFGDYGTAFGLELSMQPPTERPAEPAPAAPTERDSLWKRLSGRSGGTSRPG